MTAETPEDRGMRVGMALAAAIVVRTFDNPTIAKEILGAAGLDSRRRLSEIELDDYDKAPLMRLFQK